MSTKFFNFLLVSVMLMTVLYTSTEAYAMDHDHTIACVREISKYTMVKCENRDIVENIHEVILEACMNSFSIDQIEQMACPQ